MNLWGHDDCVVKPDIDTALVCTYQKMRTHLPTVMRSCPVWRVSVCPSRTVIAVVSISICWSVLEWMTIFLKPPRRVESSLPFTDSSAPNEKTNTSRLIQYQYTDPLPPLVKMRVQQCKNIQIFNVVLEVAKVWILYFSWALLNGGQADKM